MDGQVARQTSSYRQGLVLGLTMAEIVLLLVFCLLIAMATFIHREQAEKLDAQTKLKAAESQLRREQESVDVGREFAAALERHSRLAERWKRATSSGEQRDIDEFWRELVETPVASSNEKTNMQEAREGHKLKAAGLDAETAIRNTEIVGSIRKVAPGVLDPAKPPVEIARALENRLREAGPSGHRWPPIIDISEARGRNFQIGRAELSEDFQRALEDKIPQRILEIIKQYDVDVIEVVGHTDEQPLGKKPSNLDSDLLAVLNNSSSVANLVPADNAGLGLARAVSVVSVLRRNKALKSYKIIPLSGAQLINTDETLTPGISGDIPERRRIEIRVRKSPQRESVGPTPRARATPSVPREEPQRPAAPSIFAPFQWPWARP
jgi:flagellar motor protein MotB